MKSIKTWIIWGLVFAACGALLYIYFDQFFAFFHKPKVLKEWILSYGSYSVLVYILLQIAQVVILFIPGEVIQVVGGMVYGTLYGTILSFIGIMLGCTAAFYLAKALGRKRVDRFLGGGNHPFMKKLVSYGEKPSVILIFHMIPGAPKDIAAFLCGVSNVSFRTYITYSMLGRIPALWLSSLFGKELMEGNYTSVIVILIAGIILTVLGFWGKKKWLEHKEK